MDVTSVAATAGASSSGPSESATSLASLSEDFDTFLGILTTQLQNQDPLSPMDTNEFTQQLVQFASVEQLVQQNANLEDLLSLQKSNQAIAAVSYIDKVVEAAGRENMLSDGAAVFSYTLPEAAAAASIEVFAENGDLVYQQPVETDAGVHDFVWDGTTSRGGTAPEGVYSFRVTAVNGQDQNLEVQHRILGKVNAVTFENGVTTLGIGDVGVPLTEVKAIHSAAPGRAAAG